MSERHEWAEEPLGSTAEELARLVEAIGEWAKDSRVAHLAESFGEHLDTGAPECAYCPLCRTVHVLRESSPEVKVHLASAAASLMQAAAAVLNAAATGPGAGPSDGPSEGPSEGEDAHSDGVRAEEGATRERVQRSEKVERIDLDGWS
ncbi:hypothetical protein J2S40_001008 [Nocardioides luteus]|uniref:Uncharacterized protein n=1 Tax=Nocardioides luteus TaxID=1844 RepID=A0ABQ5SW17_9ACTN|nr:hypothetical protein [Nocardioides luteus]MDR7309950.1 hypothetical protein [Nocardioides luteus]GGR59398.1 hypothetical protein GCM10010197_27750 [Nocardioides luteus]GLJ67141.1 hypothetical protein GCM10017579_11770 [Nocardioides luteus]